MSVGEFTILRPSDIPSRARGGGVKTIPLVTRQIGATGFINGITIFPPGGSVELHKHNCEESVVLLEGRAIVELGDREHVVETGDVTFIPQGVPHRFRNASELDEMKILWTYVSPAADRTILATGETRLIEAEHRAPVAD